MNDGQELMDQRLRRYGERWRRQVPAPGHVDVERLNADPRESRSWWLLPAAAAAVGVVIVAIVVVAEPRQHETPQPQTTQRGAGLVPWAPLAPTHPKIPAETIPATPDPSIAADAPACRAVDLRAESEMGAALGAMYLNVRLTLAGERPCRVEGYAAIQPMDNGQPVEIPVKRVDDDSSYRGPVLVADGQPALLQLSWASNWCTAPVANDAIRAQLPGGAGVLAVDGFGDSPYCNGTPGSGPTPITVRPFQPERMRPTRVRSSYASVKVNGDLSRTAAAGERVSFIVALTAPRRLVLDPCPDYTIAQYGSGVSRERRFALNCADVPYRDSSGRPYLPAKTPVSFAMETTAGSRNVYKFLWKLEVPDDAVTLGGQLKVR